MVVLTLRVSLYSQWKPASHRPNWNFNIFTLELQTYTGWKCVIRLLDIAGGCLRKEQSFGDNLIVAPRGSKKYLVALPPPHPKIEVASTEGGIIEWGGVWRGVPLPSWLGISGALWDFSGVLGGVPAGNAHWRTCILKTTERSFSTYWLIVYYYYQVRRTAFHVTLWGARPRFGGSCLPALTQNRACPWQVWYRIDLWETCCVTECKTNNTATNRYGKRTIRLARLTEA